MWHAVIVGRSRDVECDRRLLASTLHLACVRLGVSPEDLDRSAYVLAGSMQQVVDYLERLRETVGISYVTIPSDQMDEFAEVVDRLGGR
jgi:hypothetical protein